MSLRPVAQPALADDESWAESASAIFAAGGPVLVALAAREQVLVAPALAALVEGETQLAVAAPEWARSLGATLAESVPVAE